MADPPALDGQHQVTAAARAASLLGWGGLALPSLTLLGCRILPVVRIDTRLHHARIISGDGPQQDRELLEIWEWPQAAGHVPASPLAISGVLRPATTWRRGLAIARRWRGFGPTAVLTGPTTVDETCRLEFEFPGVGLVTTDPNGEPALAVPAATGRQHPARRRVLDRWVEETLYAHTLATGALTAKTPTEPTL